MSHSFTHAFVDTLNIACPPTHDLTRALMFKLTILCSGNKQTPPPPIERDYRSLPDRLNAVDNSLDNYIICHFDSALFADTQCYDTFFSNLYNKTHLAIIVLTYSTKLENCFLVCFPAL